MKKLYGVMGDPIKHSMSPDIHNDAFRRAGLMSEYVLFHVTSGHLGDAVRGARALGIGGFNVTVPHKTAIIPYLDEVDGLAGTIGAVNTVKNENGRLIGYNTDGPGYIRALKEKVRGTLADMHILLIGSGGAARGIFFSLMKDGVLQADICNRTLSKAEALIEDCPYGNGKSRALSLEEAGTRLQDYDIIIQTTSSGMSPLTDEVPLRFEGGLKGGVLVSDIIYNPLETEFLKQAGSKGAAVQNGVDMFVYQAALAFEIWTGIYPDTEAMRNIVLQKLGGI
ncbi:shikimate dehydrogenase [Peribacillus sp. SCS-37]|uniref:shikimate dehydrogenase n=1 Tax=Paraperibacillus esterisolvens TaxID=3115296 RepID=UPI00390631C5